VNSTAVVERPRHLTNAAYICAVLAFFALIYVAEWVPGLLPASPNLAFTVRPVGSIVFPLTFMLIAGLAILTALLLWRVNRLALVSMALLWLIIVSSATYSCTELRQSCGSRGALSIVFLLACGLYLFYVLLRNWPNRE
jgi:hypothetical protein